MARIHFIVNPQRPSIGLRWPHEEKKIASITKDFMVHISRGRLHAEILTRQAMEAGAELIVSVGGDSTLSEIANGLYRSSQVGRPVPKLAVYPGLHQGDTVKSMQLRANFEELLLAFLNGTAVEEKIDLGEIEFTGEFGQKIRRRFINCAGFGFSAAVISRLSRDFKMSRSKWSLMRLFFRLLPFYRHPRVSIAIDGKSLFKDEDVLVGLMHNGRYAAHGLDLSPKSRIEDRILEFTLIRKTFTIKYVMGLFALFAGKLTSASFVKQTPFHHVDILSLEHGRKVHVDFDGDCWGFLPAHVRILEQALTIIR